VNADRIVEALKVARLSDAELASQLRLPLPSVRRTRLHLVASGAAVYAGLDSEGRQTWRTRLATDQPNTYMGIQAGIEKARTFSTRS
jgi:hypothetical protein